jgi:hypothetical protein
MSDYLASWPTESPPDELTEGGLQFARLLRRAGGRAAERRVARVDRAPRRAASALGLPTATLIRLT